MKSFTQVSDRKTIFLTVDERNGDVSPTIQSAGHPSRSPFFPSQYNLLVPCRYVIDKERRLIVSTGWDRLTFAEAKAHDDQLLSDPDFDPEFNQLIDATAVTVMDMSIDEAKTLARRAIVSRTSRRAFVATNPTIFGMGRLVGTHDEIVREQDQAGVFNDLYAALKWLGLETLPQ